MIGTLLGKRYEIIEKIGEGGMATVYKAKDHKLERFVAVKVLKKEYSSDMEFVKKFKIEATAAASMSDSNIVNIYDVGSEGSLNYIVMEYVNGKTLKQIILDKKVIESDKAIEIVSQIAKGLQCAHKNNIVHRDIKPHNILVTEEGVAKVTDFGIAKASNSATITNTKQVMGSAHYFSPEQAKGGFVDCRTDIYSLGIVLYEMVTGKVPYDAESPVSIAIKHIQEPIIPPKKLNDDIPESLNKLILKAVEKEPSKRYQTAKEMMGDLNAIKNGNHNLNNNNNDENDYTRVMDAVKIDETNIYDNIDDFNKDNKEYDYTDDEDENEDENLKKKNNIQTKKISNKKKKKKILIWSTVVVIAAVICLVLAFLATKQLGGKAVKEVSIPNVIGMTKEEGQSALEAANLKFKIAGEENSDKPKGTIIICSPEVGAKVKEGFTVSVYLSKGKEEISVPLVIGRYENTAKSILESSGFKVEIKYEHNNEEKRGIVINQDPKADDKTEKEATVTITVSLGEEKIGAKSVIGKKLKEAQEILGKEFSIKTNEITSSKEEDKSKDGTVVEQDKIGEYKKGTVINLTILKYKEPEKKEDEDKKEDTEKKETDDTIKKETDDKKETDNKIELPYVINMSKEDATKNLKASGFNVVVKYKTGKPEQKGKVIDMNPKESALKGSNITITVGK